MFLRRKKKQAEAVRHLDQPGVYASLEHLIKLAPTSKGFAFLPKQPVHSILAGRHASVLRGRGLNFDELRNYLPGDDIRSIDWKVTARTREPHVRVYTEERDRPALLVVDQRQEMFFGSKKNMKSVVAAEVAAVAAWRIFAAGDRVGALVFNDKSMARVNPHRSRNTVLRILHTVCDQNQALRADTNGAPAPEMLNRALKAAEMSSTHGGLIMIVSDFGGADDETDRYIMRLTRHNDVVAVFVFDPFSTHFPSSRDLVITDSELQIELTLGKNRVRKRLSEYVDARSKRIMDWRTRFGVPVLPLSSGEDTIEQLRHLLGRASR